MGESKEAVRRGRVPYEIAGLIIVVGSILVWTRLLPLWGFPLVCAILGEAAAMSLDVVEKKRRLKRVEFMPKPVNEKKSYTWEEVALHNTADSAWIAIRGKVYDVTSFLDKHPGGFELLLLCCGRDASDMFISYHPFTDKPNQILKKFEIGEVSSYEHATFADDGGFYKECCDKLKEYFESTKLDPKNPMLLTVRMTPVYVVGVFCFYVSFVSHSFSWPARALSALLFGVCQGLPLTGWMHDASHAAIGHSETWWWTVGRVSLDWISGSSMLSWRNQHVIGHHIYTNVFGADPDLPEAKKGDFRRITEHQFWDSVYYYQHLYVPVLYGLLAIKARLQDFYSVFSNHMNGPMRVNPISAQDYLRIGSSKLFWAWYRWVVPLALFDCNPVDLAVLSFLTDLVVGYWLAFNFQVSHVSDICEFYSEVEDSSKPCFKYGWGPLQVKTSLDYAHGDPIATYLSGALNYQTAHHLFPTVSQVYYTEITPIIMDVCKKHNLRYNVLPNYKAAISGHIRHLKKMGEEGRAPELKLE
uniref:Cytochrome b5 heme-binding domain-containing protein n=1 Tax=Rhodosorus marinus TaxID=101924 RepID=A0A7S0G1W4_9RHOD|mmetsp:Transcript_11786/g.17079  ORF Transcript_11786/g.17079 Transcript_11786/m.17079 type:complete len:528 (+) Transcript_11786:100-1683(+)